MINYNIYQSHKRANKLGLQPIYFRIKLESCTLEKSTGIFVPEKQFDKKRKRVYGNQKETIEANKKLDQLEAYLVELKVQKVATTPERINYLFESILNATEVYSLSSLIDVYLEYLKTRIDNHQANQIQAVTYRKNEFLGKSIKRYMEETSRIKTTWKEVDKVFISCLINYCRNVKGYSVGHVNRLVKFIKSVLRHAIDEGLAEHTSALSVKLKSESKQIQYLDKKQLKELELAGPLTDKLVKIRDLFLMQCYTGLAYSDLMRFSKDWIYTDQLGNYFIRYNRQKNQKLATVPLLPKAMAILNQYNHCLPKISNQKYNDYLKVVGMAANLPFPLTSHIGRKTCGSLLLNSGVSIFTVKTILGHSSVKTTEQHYAQLNETGILKDLERTGSVRVVNRLTRGFTQTKIQFA